MSEQTLATRRNMRLVEQANPGRELPDCGRVEGRRAFAYSPLTGKQYAASPGDYFTLGEDEPLRDSEGQPMILVFSSVAYTDALRGDQV